MPLRQCFQGFLKLGRIKSKRTGLRFHHDAAVTVDHEHPVGPTGVGALCSVVDGIKERWDVDLEIANACGGDAGTFLGSGRIGE